MKRKQEEKLLEGAGREVWRDAEEKHGRCSGGAADVRAGAGERAPARTTMARNTRERVRAVKIVCEKMYEPVKPPVRPERALEMPTVISSWLKPALLAHVHLEGRWKEV